MKRKISNQFLANYFLMFIISAILSLCAFFLLSFAGNVLEMTLKKNSFTAQSLMQDDYESINFTPVIENGGGAQVIDQKGNIVLSEGIDTIDQEQLTMSELTELLTESQRIGIPYSYNIAYNENKNFWLVITFPTSVRIDIAIAHNTEYASKDSEGVTTAIVAVVLFYLLMLTIVTFVYSKLSSIGIIKPLRQLSESVQLFRNGNYSTRVDFKLKNEFKDIQDAFNDMAEQIEEETAMKEQSENNRKKLIADISHDLKTPLANTMGYAELLIRDNNINDEQQRAFLQTIYQNSLRANNLIIDMFELSKMDSPDFKLQISHIDVCEFLRQQIGEIVPQLEQSGYTYEVHIPEEEIFADIDMTHMQRMIQNLTANTLQHTPKGTHIVIYLSKQNDEIQISYSDNGGGIPDNLTDHIFDPFVRGDAARSTQGTGLGLAIVNKIVAAHGGSIRLENNNNGCSFIITLKSLR